MGVDIRPMRGVGLPSVMRGVGLPSVDVRVRGVGLRGLRKPVRPIYLGNSGTTMRILPGILAGQDFPAVLKGDASLSKRPMRRIVEPLKKMGAEISGEGWRVKGGERKEICPPLKICGGKLKAIKYKSKIASAQVKSCILLASLFAKGVTSVTEPVKSRDHTERILKQFGCRLKAQGSRVSVKGPVKLKSPRIVTVPGDISSAAFFIVAGCLLPNTKVVIKNVGLNPTRAGILDILKRMGADIRLEAQGSRLKGYEPSGDIIVKSSKLKGVTISPKEVVRAIDEIPTLMVAACFAKGKTVIKGIGELRVKETDRINSMVTNLKKIGADVKVEGRSWKVKGGGWRVKNEFVEINGVTQLRSARVSSYGDHRTAMSMLVAGLLAKTKIIVTGLDCINKSFPGFQKLLGKLM